MAGGLPQGRAVLCLFFVVSGAVVAVAMERESGAKASGQYGAPEWWPFRGSHVVGCTNGNGCLFAGVEGYHGYWALDIRATRDSDVYAAGAGQVEVAVADQGQNCDFLVYGEDKNCPDGSRGNLVRIKHDSTGAVTTFYLHLSSVSVKTGDWVDQNTVLGKAGDSGLAAPGAVHLHFELRHGLFAVDPVPLLACLGDELKSYPGELGGKTSWSQVTANQYTVRSDGTSCAPGSTATATALAATTTTTAAGGTTTTAPPATTATTTPAGGGTAVRGDAAGFSVPNLTIFGGTPKGVPVEPTPRATLAADASNSPQTANAASTTAVFGPATIFSSGPVTVHSEGSLGGPSVTSSTDIRNVNVSRTEVFSAAGVTSTCTASERGVSGSTTITSGVLQTSLGDRDVAGDETYVSLPLNPAPNTELHGQIESVGDSFRYVFNEQVTNPDGSLTVYAAHLGMLGPTAVGDVYIGRVDCGVSASGTTTTVPTATTR